MDKPLSQIQGGLHPAGPWPHPVLSPHISRVGAQRHPVGSGPNSAMSWFAASTRCVCSGDQVGWGLSIRWKPNPMKLPQSRLARSVFVLLGMANLAFGAEGLIKTLAIGEPAPEFNLPGIDGRNHSLQDYAVAK